MVAASSDFAILDVPRGFAPVQRAVLQLADWVLVIAGDDVSSLKNGRLLLDAIAGLEKGPNQTQVIFNRVIGKSAVSKRECEATLGRRVLADLPHERLLPTSWSLGQPLMEMDGRSSFSRTVNEVADAFVPRPRRPSGFARLRLPRFGRSRPAAST